MAAENEEKKDITEDMDNVLADEATEAVSEEKAEDNSEKSAEAVQADAEKDKKKLFTGKIAVICAAVILSGSLIFLGAYILEDVRSKAEYNRLAAIHSSMALETPAPTESTTAAEVIKAKPLLPIAEVMIGENPDASGWITIENTNVNYPVVLRKSDTANEYYLNHSFDGSQNRKGTIFMDYRTTSDGFGQSDNIVLYGHNEASNDMFGDLDLYKNNGGADWCDNALEFYKANPTITFSTNYDKATYKIVAVFVTMRTDAYDDIPLFDYHNYIDFDEARYNDFIDNVEKRNKLITEVDCQYGDRFVTLSTCSSEANDARLVIIARRVRDGESEAVDTTTAQFNPSPYYEHNWTEIYKNAG